MRDEEPEARIPNSSRSRASKVVHLSSAHPPFDTRIFHKECRTLAEAGYEVVLVVPSEQSEGNCDGVRVVPVRQARNRFERFIVTPWRVLRRAFAERADVYHFHDPDLMLVGVLLSLTRKPIIYDSHEDLPRQLREREWIPRALRGVIGRAIGLVENMALRFFSAVVSAEPVAAGRFPQAKTTVVQNFPLLTEFRESSAPLMAGRRNQIFYVGDITRARGAVEMVEAVGRLPDALDARLVLAGRFNSSGLEHELRGLAGWDRVQFLGWLRRSEVVRYACEARVGIVVLHPIPQYRDSTQSVKMFEYMAAGIPVVASNFPANERFIVEEEAGVLVDPLDIDEITRALQGILEEPDEAEEMGRRGRMAVAEKYNWETEARSLLRLYEQLLEPAQEEKADGRP